MTIRILSIILALTTATAGTLLANEPLTLEAAVNRALAQNRDLGAAVYEAEAARGRVDQAGQRPNPELEAGAQSDLLTGNDGARRLDLGLTQAIPLGHRLREAQTVARVGIESARVRLANMRRLLAGDVTKLYVDLLALDQQIELRDRLIKANVRLVELSRAREKVGEVSAVDVNAAALELAKLEQERAAAAADRATRLQALKPMLGASPDEAIEITGDLDTLAQLLSRRTDRDPATWNRPDLKLATLALTQIEAAQGLARVEAKGDLIVGATYGYDRGASGDADHLLGVKFSIPLPVRNKNQGRLRELRAERFRAQREIEARELMVASEVAAAQQRVDQSQRIYDGYLAAVLPLAKAAEADLIAAYQQGQVPLFQVIQSQQQRLALESGALAAQATYAAALADLQVATGLDPQLARALADPVVP